MKLFILMAGLFFIAKLWAVTPEIGASTFTVNTLECPIGQSCITLEPAFCSRDNIEISPNNDGTFDIVFNNFNVVTNSSATYASASCLLEVPVIVSSNQQITLKEVSIAGVTVVPPGGRSTASITHFFGGRESTRIEAFDTNDSFYVTHAQELSDEYSDCGSGNVRVSTRIDVTASRDSTKTDSTFLNLSSGSGRLEYKLDYRDCNPDPGSCANGQFQVDGVCYDIGDECSDYHGTNTTVCNNGYDSLYCDWNVQSGLCTAECGANQYEYNNQCYNLAGLCSGYDGTNTHVCNNGSDSLYCDWIEQTRSCVDECSSGATTFELDGHCYQQNGSCAQYNGTNLNTCTTDLDNMSCTWIPADYYDNSSLDNTCVSSCPSGSFALGGRCYKREGTCDQYNGTDSATCNSGQDSLYCDWNATTGICYPE